MNSEHSINILPFALLREEVVFCFSETQKTGYQSVYTDNLPKEYPQSKKDALGKHTWWSLTGDRADLDLSVNLENSPRFSKHYLNFILFQHFRGREFLLGKNFINDTVVLVHQGQSKVKDCDAYDQFTLRIVENNLISGLGLLVTYDGERLVFTKSLEEQKIHERFLSKVRHQGVLVNFNELSEPEKTDKANIFPVVNYGIRKALNLGFDWNFSENKYKKYFDKIEGFYEKSLKSLEIEETMKILTSGFHKIPTGNIRQTSENSNLLVFGENRTNFVPYNGIKESGPLERSPHEDVKFFFIFHEEDKDYANKLFSYFKRGYKNFPGIYSFAKLPFVLDENKTIRFIKDNPVDEIAHQLESFDFTGKSKYAAIYLSRIRKNSGDEEEDAYYFRIKELLLRKGVVSQVIYRENINNPSFNFFLPNISIALLAKLGGVPWRLYRQIRSDLVVGVGVDRQHGEKTYVGSAFCFQNDGRFKGFNVFEENDVEALSRAIEGAIEGYISDNHNFDRLVIHYYKSMRGEEERIVSQALHKMKASVPYVVLTISETASKDYVVFDDIYDGKMPRSGTFVKLRFNEFLLCNNTRYSAGTASKVDGFPFPVKIRVKPSLGYQKTNDIRVVQELVDQVYQFSRMYWKSVRQRNLPVTIEYSKIMAKIVRNFESKDLGEFARTTLWFL